MCRRFGYAFIVLRDKQEAEEAIESLHQKVAPQGYIIHARKAAAVRMNDKKEETNADKITDHPVSCPVVNLREQLFPACMRGLALEAQVERHQSALDLTIESEENENHMQRLVDLICEHYQRKPRQEINVSGKTLPDSVCRELEHTLQTLRWPPVLQRKRVTAEQYLLLYRGKRNDGFETLAALAEKLMTSCDPDYGFTMVAVTKNFIGSPHTDAQDTSFQYAVSFGSFTEGGQLCVEGEDPRTLYVVDTHNKIAKVDGRYVHWVRPFQGGDRYSLIFFTTSEKERTERTKAVF